MNKSKFYDVSWDRKFIYSPAFIGYASDVALLFAAYADVTGLVSDDGSACTSSLSRA